jgi:hypothetical protein
MPGEVALLGINGSNPLAFLAALGAFRVLNATFPKDGILMSWRSNGAWNPVIRASRNIDEQELVEAITSRLCEENREPIFEIGDDLKVKPEDYRKYSKAATRASSLSQRDWADFVAAFGCDLLVGEDGYIQDTHLRTMSGAGHQHFIKNMRTIKSCTESHHIHKTLFEIWQYDDPLENLSMRWDPMDDQRYAMRWSNPSGDPIRKKRGSMLGANRLAIEALPVLPAIPVGDKLKTIGFKGTRSTNTFWTWPIWEPFISLDTTRSLLAMKEFHIEEVPRDELYQRGIVEVFRSQRLTIGKFRNFTMGQPV